MFSWLKRKAPGVEVQRVPRLLAIMKRVQLEGDDLAFGACISETQCAGQRFLLSEDVRARLKEHGISDFRQLEGMPCWVLYIDGRIAFHDFCFIT